MVKSAVRDFAKALGLPPGEIERLARAVDPWKERNDIEEVPEPARRSPRWDALVRLPATPGAAAPPVAAPRRDGDLDPAADRPRLGAAGLDGGAPDGAGQGLMRRRRLPQDRPVRPRHALGGRALRRRDRACAASASTCRASPTTTRRSTPASRRRRRWGCSRSSRAPRCRCSSAPAPRTLDDLTVQVALVRPGPIQGGAVHPYIERRKALRADPAFEIPYEHPSLSPCCATCSARSSSRTRCSRWPRPSPASAPGRPRDCAVR